MKREKNEEGRMKGGTPLCRLMTFTTAALIVPMVALVSCGDSGTNPDGIEPTFSSIQENIFSKNCLTSSCHSTIGQRAGLILEPAATAYSNLINVTPSTDSARVRGLKRVVPGKPDSSFLYIKLTGPREGEGDLMPQSSGGLTQEAIDAIRTWIENGAKMD